MEDAIAVAVAVEQTPVQAVAVTRVQTRPPPDYSKGKIYCVKSKVSNDIYIGSTTQSLSDRFAQHKSDAKREVKKGPLYRKIRELGVANFFIELICNFPCESR